MYASHVCGSEHRPSALGRRLRLRAPLELAIGAMLVIAVGSGCGAAPDDRGIPSASSTGRSSGADATTGAAAASGAGVDLSAGAASPARPDKPSWVDAGQSGPDPMAPPLPVGDVGGAPLPMDLEAFTMDWAFPLLRSEPGAVCDAFGHPNRFEYENASRTLTWDWCLPSPTTTLLQGRRVLDDAEALRVTSAYGRITLVPATCGIDDPVIFLDVRSTTGSAEYVLATMGCYPAFQGLTYVDDGRVIELLDVLQELSRSP